MKTIDFIKALEDQKIIPSDIIEKLRGKLEKTDKDVSAKSVAKYLIDKGYLSKFQAKQLLTGVVTPSSAREELDLQVPQEQIDDTNELLKDLKPAATSPKPAPDATRVFTEQDEAVPVEYDASIEVVNVDVEQTVQHGMDMGAMAQGAQFDPLGGGGFDSNYGETVEESPLDAFKGKKGKKNQWDSKWIFIGSSVLALLIMVGVILAFTIFKADSAKLWEKAVGHFNNGRYSAALQDFQLYIKNFPRDEKVHDARVKIANCELRMPYDSRQWGTALSRAQTVLPKLEEDLAAAEKAEKFSDLRSELGVILPGTALGFTEKGLESDDVEVKKEQLKLAEDTMELINNPSYVPGSEKRKPGVNINLQTLADNIAKIQRQIKMEHDYVSAVDAMNQLTEDGDTENAFQMFEELTSVYPELRTREGLQDAMLAISLREAQLVKRIDVDLTAPEMPESPIASSVILATKSGQRSIAGLSSEMLVYLIDGSLYGLRAADGNVAWQRFVGVETDIEPVWLESDRENKSDLIVTDSRDHDLMRISASDGKEVWRVNVGEPFARPHVSSIGLLVTTLSGKVMVIDPGDGSVSSAAQVPKTTSVSGVVIEGTPFIYQLADDSNIYVISTQSMTCREVYYLGHDPRSVTVPPFVMSGHIIVPVNAAEYCNLHVLKPFENGLKLGPAQVSLRMTGQVNTPLYRYGRWGLVISDEGDLRMLEVQKANEESPISVVVKQKISSKRRTRNFLKAESGDLWLSGAGMRRFRIHKARGEFKEEAVANNLDLFIGPSAVIGETLFHVRRRHDSSMVSISAVDPATLQEVWRTDLAAPLAGPPVSDGSDILAISAQGDVFKLDEATIQAGVSNSPAERGSTVVQSLVFNNVVEFEDKLVITGPLDRRSILEVDLSQSPPKTLTDLQPPADKLACKPIAFGDRLLVATLRGQVFRINTETGQPVGAPFQPALAPNTETHWRRPVAIDDSRFIIGDAPGRIFLVEAEGENSLQKLHELDQAGDLLSPMIGVDGNAFAVVRDDAGDRIIQIPFADQLEVTLEVDLPGGYVDGPIQIADDRMIVFLDTGDTVCFNSQLEQQWTATLPPEGNDRLAGKPVQIDGQLMMAFVSGTVISVNPATGEVNGSVDLGLPIAHPPVVIGDKYFVTGADGTLHQLRDLALFQ